MSELRIRVEDLDGFFRRARDEARRLDAGLEPLSPHELSFESVETLGLVLAPGRWAVMSKLRALGPSSIRALAKALGRDYRGVHSDVGRLLEVGLIERNEAGKVLVPWSKITAEVYLDKAA